MFRKLSKDRKIEFVVFKVGSLIVIYRLLNDLWNGEHLSLPKLNNGTFTFIVFTISGEYKISCTLKNGLPIKP